MSREEKNALLRGNADNSDDNNDEPYNTIASTAVRQLIENPYVKYVAFVGPRPEEISKTDNIFTNQRQTVSPVADGDERRVVSLPHTIAVSTRRADNTTALCDFVLAPCNFVHWVSKNPMSFLIFAGLPIITAAIVIRFKIKESTNNDYSSTLVTAKMCAAVALVAVPFTVVFVCRSLTPFYFSMFGKYGHDALGYVKRAHAYGFGTIIILGGSIHGGLALYRDPQVKSGANLTGLLALLALIFLSVPYWIFQKKKEWELFRKKVTTDYSTFLRWHQFFTLSFLICYTIHMGIPKVNDSFWKTRTHPAASLPFVTGAIAICLWMLNIIFTCWKSKDALWTSKKFPKFPGVEKIGERRFYVTAGYHSSETILPGSYMGLERRDVFSEAHPFDVAHMKENGVGGYTLGFVIGVAGDWTEDFLKDLVNKERHDTRIKMTGPYASSLCGMETCDRFMLVSGGTGLSSFLGYLSWLSAQPAGPAALSILVKQSIADIALFLPVLMQVNRVMSCYSTDYRASSDSSDCRNNPTSTFCSVNARSTPEIAYRLIVVLCISGATDQNQYSMAFELLRTIALGKLGLSIQDEGTQDFLYPEDPKMMQCPSFRYDVTQQLFPSVPAADREGNEMRVYAHKLEKCFGYLAKDELYQPTPLDGQYPVGLFLYQEKKDRSNFSRKNILDFAYRTIRDPQARKYDGTLFYCGPKPWQTDLDLNNTARYKGLKCVSVSE